MALLILQYSTEDPYVVGEREVEGQSKEDA